MDAQASDPAASAVVNTRTGRNLPIAIATGVGLAAVFLGALYWHPLAVLTLVFLVVVIAVLELGSAFADAGTRPATAVVLATGLVSVFGTHYQGASAQVVAVVLLLVGAAVWALFVGPGGGRAVGAFGSTLMVGVWVPFSASFFVLLLDRPDGIWYVMATIALSVSADIGAYGFGAAFGRHKLAPRVSPGKTWEGLAGGLATVLLLATFVTSRLPGFDVTAALVVATSVALAATVGDLAESAVKRDLGVKDLGRILPGHGGIMDRVDSIIFALPAAHFALLAVGL